MPARTSRFTWRPAAAALPALLLTFGAAMPASAAQAVAPATASSHIVMAAPSVVLAGPVSSVGRLASHAPAARHARAAVAPVSRAALVLREAASLRGRPYQYGAAGPRSFDCSGFTRYVFATAVGRSLPHSAAAQYALSHKIAKSAIRPGDLVFFVSYGHVYHVGIYAGHGLIWHAPHTGDRVRLARIFSSSWVAGRVL
jgi:cell wall-associated NlpC family hydrolase